MGWYRNILFCRWILYGGESVKRLLWCDYCNEQGNSLESECDSLRWALRKQKELDNAEIDRLRAEVKVSHDEYYRLEADRDKLKAELEHAINIGEVFAINRDLWKSTSEQHDKDHVRIESELVIESNQWKSKASKLAEALREIEMCHTGVATIRKIAKAALAEFEGWGFR